MDEINSYGVKEIVCKGEEVFVFLTYSPRRVTLERKFQNLPVSYVRTKLQTEEDFNLFTTAVERFGVNMARLTETSIHGDELAVSGTDPQPSTSGVVVQKRSVNTEGCGEYENTLVLTSNSDEDNFIESQMKAVSFWFKVPKGILRSSFIFINNLYCIPTYVIWMLLLWPIRKINSDLYWKVEGYLFHWLLAMVALWCDSAGYKIVEAGEDISECLEKRTLILANHQSTADVPMLFSCYNTRKHILPNIMWIMDSLFKYTNFGVVSYSHQDFFIKSGKLNRDKALQNLSKHLLERYVPLKRKWLMLFPEGGFLRKRKAVSHRYAEKNNLPKFENVSLPRVGALKIIMNSIGPHSSVNNNSTSKTDCQRAQHIDYILDITIAYPKGVPIDISHIAFGNKLPCETVFFYRLYRATEVPHESEAMTNWLFQRWGEKEKMLQTYYDTGVFPTEYSRTKPREPKLVVQDYLRFLILHIFFIISSYIHVRMFLLAYQCCLHLVY